MILKGNLRGLLTFFCIVISSCLYATPEQDLTDSNTAALQWLKIVDSGEYGDSWQATSLRTKLTMQRGEWEELMKAIRKPLGNALSRKIAEQSPAKNPKNLAKGDYMMIVYTSTFANKSNATELVTLVKGDDGKWYILTYLVS
jgi:hypothetical protein